jgi:hypothetical protein
MTFNVSANLASFNDFSASYKGKYFSSTLRDFLPAVINGPRANFYIPFPYSPVNSIGTFEV